MSDRVNPFMDAVKNDDAAAVRQLLSAHANELKPALDAPIPGWAFGETPLIAAVRSRNREMLDALLDAGADINGRTHWWAGGFGLFDEISTDSDLVQHLIERGAIVDVHAAARLGKLDHLRMLLIATPALIHSRGGDGMLPLHFAATLEIARFLVEECGAPLDALDIDHESTAAQYMVRERQDIARYLVSRGCKTDILLAAALGNEELLEQHLSEHPESLETCVSPFWFPMRDYRAGGTIYNWTLGPLKTAHQVAHEFGHADIFAKLMERSGPALRLAMACELGVTPPDATLPAPVDYERIVRAAQMNESDKVRRMLDAGWPIGTRDGGGATPLHWAAFHGNPELVSLLLDRGAATDSTDFRYGGAPLAWASHGPSKSWIKGGDYPAVVRLLSGSEATSADHTPSA